jgi:hypothetical protein
VSQRRRASNAEVRFCEVWLLIELSCPGAKRYDVGNEYMMNPTVATGKLQVY